MLSHYCASELPNARVHTSLMGFSHNYGPNQLSMDVNVCKYTCINYQNVHRLLFGVVDDCAYVSNTDTMSQPLSLI